MSLEKFSVSENRQEYSIIGNLASGEDVIIRSTSHIHTNPNLEKYLAVALGKIESHNQTLIESEVDFGEFIGVSSCVATTEKDEIVFAMRPQRKGFTRFVKQRNPEPTTKLTVILSKDRQTNKYLVLTTYIGAKSEPEPWDYKARGSSLAFWRNHALVYGEEPILDGTETTEAKW